MADSNTFSLRIVSLDYYMASPIPGLDISYSSFHGGRVNEVPVIRIYGSTPAGQKTCLHVHGVLPYLYLPCADIPIQQNKEGDAYTHQLSLALEKALKLKSKASSKQQYVHGCSLVRGKRFYGYHSSEELFVKIYLYHQQDVSRAASILLGGEVLDKCLQPHEAHIPFILQFLVDYNLYGMGHVHLSKLKFRHPIPDGFSPLKSVHIEQATPNIVADISESPAFASPIWISSTVPDEWTWHSFGEFDESSFNPVMNATKRQSLCQLEGDASVDDILNQQRKTFTSLSQTRSDVKMVQSLVPIWEEEYERTGMHDIEIPADTNKPLPEDVLKTLSLGSNFLVNHVDHNEEDIYSTPPDKQINPVQLLTPMMKDGFLVALGYTPNSVGGEASECLKERGVSLVVKEDTSVKVSCKDPAVDTEAMGLLKWLASSQAMDDINSDDELLRDSILGSFLHENTIDEVLEKATMEYESESQKECREILDSIDDMNEKADFPVNDFKTSLEKTIPQVDGAGDDIFSTPDGVAKANSETQDESKIGKNFQQPILMEDALVEDKSSEARKRKKKKILWGSLPFSVSDKSKIEHESVNSRYKSTGKEENSVTKIEKDSTPLVGCSIRDLMRRKRHYRVEPVQSNSHEAEKILLEVRQEESTNTCHSESMLHEVYDVADTDEDSPLDENSRFNHFDHVIGSSPLDAQAISSYSKTRNPNAAVMVHENEVGQETDIAFLKSDHGNNTAPNKDEFSRRISGKDQLSEEYPHEVSYEKQDGINMDTIINSTSINIEQSPNREVRKFDPQHEDLLSLTVCRKPPAPNLMDNSSSKASSPHLDHRDGITEKAMEDCLPFFTDDSQIGTEVKNKCMELSNSSPQQEHAIGVPVHYQNDGAFFYLLSPVRSPPSAEKVKRWFSSGTNVGEASSSKSYAQLGASSNLVSSPSSSPDDDGKASSKSGDVCDQNIETRGSQDNRAKINSSKEKMICNDGAAMIQKEGNFAHKARSNNYSQDSSQISGPDGRSKPTPLSQIGFRDPASSGGGQQLTLLSIEVIAASRGDLQPDPRFDAINIVTLAVQNDGCSDVEVYVLLHSKSEDGPRNLDGTTDCILLMFHEEKHLLNHFVKFVRFLDPDILIGWDVQGGSLGFLAERAAHLGIGILDSISRTPSENKMASEDTEYPGKELDSKITDSELADPGSLEDAIIEDEWGRTHASGVHVGGRIVLNVWRLMRGELKLSLYTIEAVVDAVLRRKVPHIPYKVLTRWFSSGPGRARHRCIEYIKQRGKLNLELMNQLDMINRTSELARVFGIDFFSVLSRGSQYRVESMYLRLAHTQNYLAISPGTRQVASQPAMECIPLVMEPESGFYADPVIVLDFQSLYPSMIIAYNLCYSTCIGNVAPSKENILGVCGYSPDPRVLEELRNQILVTPNGVMYAPSRVRKGVLPRLLEEILSTRIMVKQAMKKLSPSQQVLYRIFNARQLALKLIANVTYGYTAAGFSGRMPCAELADSIVQCGRRTLETAISFVNSQEKWKARVIYGDTDSMFVLLKGRSVEDAFRIGSEIASEISAMNPNPVVLKMEKVYHPCFLLTKKRYVGYSYESPKQAEPVFDAKGIETVRRDTCRAVSKTMEKSLRLFFERQNISEVKVYLQRQWQRILSGRVSLQDFVFAKEVRLGSYSSKNTSSLPPAAIVATKAMRSDPRAEPRYGDRIPYIVIHGNPGARLVDMVVDPSELLAIGSPYRLNDLYYITKQIIPALQRVFGLVGADLNKWFSEMPRQAREAIGKRPLLAGNYPQRTRIDSYYLSRHCVLCGELVEASAYLCTECSGNKTGAVTALVARTSKLEREMQHLAAICRHCGGGDWLVESGVKCTSLACQVFYERCKLQKELQGVASVAADQDLYPKCMVEWF